MGNTHLVIPDPHAHFKHDNNRALYVGELIKDIRPDVVINLGDTADMPSLSGYDKGRKSFFGKTYQQDIDAHNDFQDKLWARVKRTKKKLPRRVTLIGNHEHRIERAVEMAPELDGKVGYNDLQLNTWYDDVVYYHGGTPGVIQIDGVHYAHYFISGIMGRAIGGEHPGYQLLTKHYQSCTAGHQHIFDHCIRTTVTGRKLMGLVAGCLVDYDTDWAGEINHLWWPGVVIKTDVADGVYDIQTISLKKLKEVYGHLN